jgi:hypothetical protein
MTYKRRHIIVFFFALGLGAVAMYVEMNLLLRVLVAGFLLIPIIYAVEGLGISKLLSVLPDPSVRHRRFADLRSEVKQLLDLVRRLNWLNFDLERGDRNEEDVKAEIASAELRLDEILTEIRSAAGRSSRGMEVNEETEDLEAGVS